jgi:V8-like Glu-specific endopeptidase
MIVGGEDYQYAIARIFEGRNANTNAPVVGTGFLVAPGYVLTCAHVVLSALGIEEEEFKNYTSPPSDRITLNFHVLASTQPIQAEVVAWLPYSLEAGDIAALKLLSPEPEGAKPLPLNTADEATTAQGPLSIYGFGESRSGGQSGAYRPKTTVAARRIQLCKVGDPNGETIQGGFSGAPVWNEDLNQVIGMIATAAVSSHEQRSKAYAIPTVELQPILKQVEALQLYDLLRQNLEAFDDQDDSARLERSITQTLQRCNPDGESDPWRQQLKELSSDRTSIPDWETEGRLIRFAVMLALMEDTPRPTYDGLKVWVEQRQLDFAPLLERLTGEMKDKKLTASNVCEHLMVGVEPEETAEQWRVSMWAIADLATYNPNRPPPPLVRNEILTLSDLPTFIRKQIRKHFRRMPTPIIHLFIPRDLLCQGVEMWPSSQRAVLGSEYPCVLRTNLKTHPIDYYYYDDWHEKWRQLASAWETATVDVFETLDCQQDDDTLFKALKAINAAVLKNCAAVGELFDVIAEDTALPIALWSRDAQYQDTISDVLDCIVKQLPERIRRERYSVHNAKNPDTLGHHLSLVWEDPQVVPPDMQFDPEAC